MAGELELYIDITSGGLVKGLNTDEVFSLPKFGQGSLVAMRVFLVRPIEGAVAPPLFEQVAIDSMDFRLSIGPRAGATSLLAYQDTWAKQIADEQGKSGYFYASVNLNTTELNNAISTSETINTYLETQTNPGSGWKILSSHQITVVAAVRDPTGAVTLPTAAANYPTWPEADAVYVRKLATSGDRIVLSVGSYAVEMKVNTDGTVGLNVVQ